MSPHDPSWGADSHPAPAMPSKYAKKWGGPGPDFGPDTEPTGGTRYSAGKPNLVHVPLLGLYEVARVSEYGGDKYAPRDWMEGQSIQTLLACAMRHLIRGTLNPWSRDPESGFLHLAHAAWNILAALHFYEDGRVEEVDDVTPWNGVVAADRDRVAQELRDRMERGRVSRGQVRT